MMRLKICKFNEWLQIKKIITREVLYIPEWL